MPTETNFVGRAAKIGKLVSKSTLTDPQIVEAICREFPGSSPKIVKETITKKRLKLEFQKFQQAKEIK